MSKQLRDFVRVSDGRVGLIVRNDSTSGMFRDEYEIWFGDYVDDFYPLTEILCRKDDWKSLSEFGYTDEKESHCVYSSKKSTK